MMRKIMMIRMIRMIRMARTVRMVMMIRMIGWSAGLVRMIRIRIKNVMFIRAQWKLLDLVFH